MESLFANISMYDMKLWDSF